MFAGINLLLAVFVWFCIPETKKVTLEEIDVLFGGSNHVDKGADLMGVEDSHHARVSSETGMTRGEGKSGVDRIEEIKV